MRKSGNAKLVAAAMAAAMMLTACGGGGASSETTAAGGESTTAAPSAGGESTTAAPSADAGSGNIGRTDIVFAMNGDIVALDPAQQQDTTSSIILKHVYSTLMDTDVQAERRRCIRRRYSGNGSGRKVYI